MFEYLNEFLQTLVSKISSEEMFNINQKGPEYAPLLGDLMDNQTFWCDLIRFHFKTEAMNPQLAKGLFVAEYYFSKGNYNDALALGSFRASMYLVYQEITSKKFDKAMEYAERERERYTVLGDILCLQTCQSIINETADSAIAREYADRGFNYLSNIEAKKNDATSLEFLQRSGWMNTFKTHYGNMDGFLEQGRLFLERTFEDNPAPRMGVM